MITEGAQVNVAHLVDVSRLLFADQHGGNVDQRRWPVQCVMREARERYRRPRKPRILPDTERVGYKSLTAVHGGGEVIGRLASATRAG